MKVNRKPSLAFFLTGWILFGQISAHSNALISPLQGYDGKYSLEAQLDHLRELKAQGKLLKLIIGRGNKESRHAPLPTRDDVEWVFGNIDGRTLTSKDGRAHLWMDFNQEEDLKKLDSQLFSQIIIDSSTWKFLDKIETNLPQYARLLAPEGRLYFEALRGDHIRDGDKITYWPEAVPHSFSIPMGFRTEDALEEVLVEIYKRYRTYFPKIGFSKVVLLRDGAYPIKTTWPIKDYFEATQ